ncbi:MAG: FHA domain-containing protein [Symploca sp. SIO3C6]|uniref:FHA domain-containing protein n=1 Tax=Symploca sp. SIO1C4 TaxID=2607765 RepID=A0A6B3NNB2_9CYAN|nr:FHA domain-containing protein [Symploca sp. SIO3C6]NER31031.1 FHA domain-containing protein [Symploca sp. SIO1C4]NET05728.1 FHA domain-containing protein [Symploca sp. SIO2B6]
MQAYLIIEFNGQTETYKLSEKFTTIGRYQSSSICLPCETISRRHAYIHFNDEGIHIIFDGCPHTGRLSKNGIWVNNSKVDPDQGEILNSGDTILLSREASIRYVTMTIGGFIDEDGTAA